MIMGGELLGGIDLVDISLALFTLFFIGLVLHLQREGMREGYPSEQDTTGRVDTAKPFVSPKPKTFKLAHGRGDVDPEKRPRESRELAIKRTEAWPGAPYEPTGDPMADGVGPASWAERADYPDLTLEGTPRIVPFRSHPEYFVPDEDKDPRGLPVIGVDGKVGGKVVDLWVDVSEAIIRYHEVEVETATGTKRVLLPVPFANLQGGRKPAVTVHAITGSQFAGVPETKSPDSVTRLEEDKIAGYYGGGTLYATPKRSEPLL
ncbi:MAG: photosynthetic reaction center subunit H [Pseudomonadota bacterium]